ncbi:hypothetical protein [Cytobacillus horneckiae]|uniref:hypothetical protein n=1 Tax=Cytobacillus horneckiae TaxID=549687 RepID=UPI003D202256
MKLEIANMLYGNSIRFNNSLKLANLGLGDGEERGLIERYIKNYKKIQNRIYKDEEYDGVHDELMVERLDKCLGLIVKENISMKDWLLFEIPISDVFTFVNMQEHIAFDLIFNDSTEAVPNYLDDSCINHPTKSIKEAIERYHYS